MQVGDLVRFTSTGCHGMIVDIKKHPGFKTEFVYILCGPDADGIAVADALAFPRPYIDGVLEVISESR